MSYAPASRLADAGSPRGGSQRATVIDQRVDAAIVACQTFLVVRILSVLLGVSLLPSQLPTVLFHLDASHAVILALGGINRGAVLVVVGVASAAELYLAYRLADRKRFARFGVLLMESCAIVTTTVALAFGAGLAILPLATSIGATCLLLLNQVRWAFLLQPKQRDLTGRRQGGTFAGYAAPALDSPKPPQRIGYQVRRDAPREAQVFDASTKLRDVLVEQPEASRPAHQADLAWPSGR
jgi:hypothetical protein